MRDNAGPDVPNEPGRGRSPENEWANESKLKVLYLVGWGRSGSTIIDNSLGAVDGVFSAGELHYIWRRGILERRRCGCGQPIVGCDLWTRTLHDAYGDCDLMELAGEMVGLQQEWVRVRHTWRLLRHRRPIVQPGLGGYLTRLGELYGAIVRVTGARLVVDSSKRPSDAAALRLIEGIEPYFVHLVRDPRAVAFSWQRRKVQPDRGAPAEMVRHSTARSGVNWMLWNLAAESLRRRLPGRSLLIRYEDFVADPRAMLQSMLALADEDPSTLPLEDGHTVRLTRNHTVSGNPSRFATGPVRVREDSEWRVAQSATARRLTTALCMPLLRRYDYPVRVRRPGEAARELDPIP